MSQPSNPRPLYLLYAQLRARLTAHARKVHARVQTDPEATAGPVMVKLASELLRDTFRLTSRESFGRAVPRLDPNSAIDNRALFALLMEADAATAAWAELYQPD